MEMTYGGALVMPSSYAMMDEEEMTYVEGGYLIDLEVNTVAKWTDVLVAVAIGVSAITWSVKRLIAMRGMGVVQAISKEIVTRLGLSLSVAYNVVNIVAKIADITPGLCFAVALDWVDRSGLNGRVQFNSINPYIYT